MDSNIVDNVSYKVFGGTTCAEIATCITDQVASEVPFDSTGTGLSSTEVQSALQEIAGMIPVDTDTFASLVGTVLTLPDGQTIDLEHVIDTDTFATINGTTITFADGSTQDLGTLDTDTFATINGNTITFADGSTAAIVDTNTFSTLAGTVITFSNGSTFDLATLDTNTFSTLTGTVITFSNGASFDISSVDTNTFATLAGTTITFANGATLDLATINTDTFATVVGNVITFANGATMTVTDDQNASEVPLTPVGPLTATDVQSAIAEIVASDSEYVAISEFTRTEAVTDGSGEIQFVVPPNTGGWELQEVTYHLEAGSADVSLELDNTLVPGTTSTGATGCVTISGLTVAVAGCQVFTLNVANATAAIGLATTFKIKKQ